MGCVCSQGPWVQQLACDVLAQAPQRYISTEKRKSKPVARSLFTVKSGVDMLAQRIPCGPGIPSCRMAVAILHQRGPPWVRRPLAVVIAHNIFNSMRRWVGKRPLTEPGFHATRAAPPRHLRHAQISKRKHTTN